jgi:hypothetical protein
MAEWIYFNPNPRGYKTGDCVIRAICAVTGQTWEETYTGAALQGYVLSDMPSANHVWRAYLKSLGFNMYAIPNTFPDCYTVADFADDHPKGRYVLGLGNHAIGIVDGVCYDTWNSLSESPIYYFAEE